MPSSPEDLARHAASQLAPEFGSALPAHLEAALRKSTVPPQRYDATTVIALATLLLNIAKVAWDIYQDCKKTTMPPAPDAIARRLRLEVRLPEGVSVAHHDRIIAAVLEELPRS